MDIQNSFISDFRKLIFTPQNFFSLDYKRLTSKRIYWLGIFGLFFGIVFGNLFNWGLVQILEAMVENDIETYKQTLLSSGIGTQTFFELMQQQKAYSILAIILSVPISYMLPHLFGGALHVFLKIFIRADAKKISLQRTMECATISLSFMIFYGLPVFGPFIAILLVGINLSRALFICYELSGFFKIASIAFSIYICFFLASASLQVLAAPFAKLIFQ